jgi:hypothetical protein
MGIVAATIQPINPIGAAWGQRDSNRAFYPASRSAVQPITQRGSIFKIIDDEGG